MKNFVTLAGGLALAFAVAADPLLTFPLQIGDHKLRVEVAASPEERQKGLMHRRTLGEHQGMVFVFDQPGLWGMWMKNTHIPLSVAFIAENGRIINIENMQPHSEESHSARAPAKYALEVNQGWFEKRGVRSGAKVGGLKALPAPR